MSHSRSLHQWSRHDRLLYFATLAPFLVAFCGAAYLLSTVSIYLTATFVSLYIIGNIFQAGCCVGCPYRGGFCPSVFGMYLANLLSATFYRKRSFEPRFFRINANLAEISLLATLLFPVYWLLSLNWLYLVVFLLLVVLHVVSFFPLICPKCSYNDTCPGGQTTLKLFGK